MRLRWGRLVCSVLVLITTGSALADHGVVIVSGADSVVEKLTSLELRKLYLGVTVRRQGVSVKAIRNTTDPQLVRIFLQVAVGMSEASYERRLLSLTLKYGTPRPVDLGDRDALLQAMRSDRYAITYMWEEDAAALPDFKILKVLWHK